VVLRYSETVSQIDLESSPRCCERDVLSRHRCRSTWMEAFQRLLAQDDAEARAPPAAGMDPASAHPHVLQHKFVIVLRLLGPGERRAVAPDEPTYRSGTNGSESSTVVDRHRIRLRVDDRPLAPRRLARLRRHARRYAGVLREPRLRK
jgi:hypothetical protein